MPTGATVAFFKPAPRPEQRRARTPGGATPSEHTLSSRLGRRGQRCAAQPESVGPPAQGGVGQAAPGRLVVVLHGEREVERGSRQSSRRQAAARRLGSPRPQPHRAVPVGPHGPHDQAWAAPPTIGQAGCLHEHKVRHGRAACRARAVAASNARRARLVRDCHKAARVGLRGLEGGDQGNGWGAEVRCGRPLDLPHAAGSQSDPNCSPRTC